MKYILSLTLMISITGVIGQQNRILYQYMLFKPLTNFASSTAFDGVNFALGYQKQWVGLDGSPQVAQAMVTIPILKSSNIGIIYEGDEVGVHKRNSLKLAYAYSLFLTRKSKLAFSLTARADQQTSNYMDLYAAQAGDPVSSISYSIWNPNFEVSMFFNTKRFYAGVGTSNILKNEFNFFTTQTNRTVDAGHLFLNFQSGYRFKLSDKIDMTPSTFIKIGNGAPINADFNLGFEFNQKFGLGVSYRTTGDLVPIAFLRVKDFMLSYAFAYSTSEIRRVSSGSHEIFLNYQLKSKKKILTIKSPRF
jgi:type IX secretion system PorP/SprF family membrane protein